MNTDPTGQRTDADDEFASWLARSTQQVPPGRLDLPTVAAGARRRAYRHRGVVSLSLVAAVAVAGAGVWQGGAWLTQMRGGQTFGPGSGGGPEFTDAATIDPSVVLVTPIAPADSTLVPSATPSVFEVENYPSVAGGTWGIPVQADGSAGPATVAGVPTVEWYFDPICPFCAVFEDVNGDDLRALVAGGEMNFVLRPLSFLDSSSQGTNYSTRAASALVWVAENDPAHALAFAAALMTDIPAEMTPGLTDAELADLARAAGVPDGIAAGIADRVAMGTYAAWVQAATNAWQADPATADSSGTRGAPSVVIDGVLWTGDWTTPGVLAAAITSASPSSDG
jgi:protein-disulfide isomerase